MEVPSPKSHSCDIATSHPILTVGHAMHEKVLAASNQVANTRHLLVPRSALALGALALGWLLCLGQIRAAIAPDSPGAGAPPRAPAASATRPANAAPAPAFPCFEVRRYQVRGDTLPSTDSLMKILANYTGTNVSLAGIVNAASALQAEYRNQGRTNASVSIASEAITNGLVTLHVFRGGVPLILVSGKPYSSSPPAAVAAANALASPKPPPTANVRAYEITGDTLLTTEILMAVLAKHTGTNLTMTNIIQAASDLQMEYRDRGFPTVKVSLPAQQITNGIVKIRVFQGRLSEIDVTHNRYFSSNNVMRALPSLRTNTILVGPVFQAELDRANANPDRQIRPLIDAGPVEGTSLLTLSVQDRLPLHGKIELNNQNSPGTPDLRLNTSAACQNLWQLEHSLGLQYSFSPEAYKAGDSWNFYDKPVVANYGGFYRLPLGQFNAINDEVARSSGSFGYDEASRKFRLPAPAGRPELNFFASRSSINTGLMTLFSGNLYNTNGNSLDRKDVQRDLTTTTDLGTRLTVPLQPTATFQPGSLPVLTTRPSSSSVRKPTSSP